MSRIARRNLIAGLLLLAGPALADRFWPELLTDFVRGLFYGVGIGLLLVALVKARATGTCDNATPALRRRYLREFLPPMVAYVVAVLVSVTWLRHIETPAWRALVALLPVPAIALAMRAIVRHIRDTDELQRQIELEAVSIATALVSLLYLSAGFLQIAKVIAIPSGVAMIWMFPLVCMVYGIAKVFVGRRFR
jgi:uncharacterized membrane protein YoaK (UPF0700 family)